MFNLIHHFSCLTLFKLDYLHQFHLPRGSWDLSFATIFSTSPPGSTTMASLDSESPGERYGIPAPVVWKMEIHGWESLMCVWLFLWLFCWEIYEVPLAFAERNRKPWKKTAGYVKLFGCGNHCKSSQVLGHCGWGSDFHGGFPWSG